LRIFAVAITPDSSTAYIPDAATDTVQVIDTGSNTVTATITGLSTAPFVPAVSPEGSKLFVYVGDFNNASVSAINTSTNTLVRCRSSLRRPTCRLFPDWHQAPPVCARPVHANQSPPSVTLLRRLGA
jgi:YVTN family beta-propeller protein